MSLRLTRLMVAGLAGVLWAASAVAQSDSQVRGTKDSIMVLRNLVSALTLYKQCPKEYPVSEAQRAETVDAYKKMNILVINQCKALLTEAGKGNPTDNDQACLVRVATSTRQSAADTEEVVTKKGCNGELLQKLHTSVQRHLPAIQKRATLLQNQ